MRRQPPGAPGRKDQEIEKETVRYLIDTIIRSKAARHEAEVEAPRKKRRESRVNAESERDEACGMASHEQGNGGVVPHPKGLKGLRQGWEARHPGIAQQVRKLPGDDPSTAVQ